MINSDLLNEIERKDLIIKNLQKQLKENISFFKSNPSYFSSNQLKNELMRKDAEISYLSSKLSNIQSVNDNLQRKYNNLQEEYFDYKLKANNQIQKLNDIIKNHAQNLNSFQNINEKMKEEISIGRASCRERV